jgi:tetratricopeptide (TPR) repeat protein
MLADRQGNPLRGATAEAVELFDQALHAFNIYRGDPVGLLDRAVQLAPAFAMAHIAKAYLLAMTAEPAATRHAQTIVEAAKSLRLDERARAHGAALEQVFQGEWTQAAIALDRLGHRYPHDLLALQCGHLIDFFRANARNLRDRIARVLPSWSPSTPGYAVVLGMYAFGLEECGDYARAEDQGRAAIALQPLDCWAQHAVAHVMEMQGRAEDGVRWMVSREPDWSGEDNSFKVHNWWHLALFNLELGRKDEALALYDGPIRAQPSGFALDTVDASALLWRLHLSGLHLGDRWQELATAWEAHADGGSYAFNDWHAVMAFLGAGRDRDVERVSAQLRRNSAERSEAAGWARNIGLPLVEGFAAFWRGDYAAATERLYAARHIVNAFGGSHAQRDVIDWTLTEAAVRGGFKHLARALVNERLAHKPRSRPNCEFLSRLVGNATASVLAA